MSNKKYFSHGIEQSAIDVIHKKRGYELLKFYKERIPGTFMKSFPSYEQFILLLRTFYFSPHLRPYNIQIPTSLRNANSTFILYDKLKDHVSSCSSCQETPNIILNRCIILKQILYPYGLYVSDDFPNKGFYLHNGLDLRLWCKPCPDDFIGKDRDKEKEHKEDRKKEEHKHTSKEKETIRYNSSLFLQENPDLYKRCEKKKSKLCDCTTNLFVGPFKSIDRKTRRP